MWPPPRMPYLGVDDLHLAPSLPLQLSLRHPRSPPVETTEEVFCSRISAKKIKQRQRSVKQRRPKAQRNMTCVSMLLFLAMAAPLTLTQAFVAPGGSLPATAPGREGVSRSSSKVRRACCTPGSVSLAANVCIAVRFGVKTITAGKRQTIMIVVRRRRTYRRGCCVAADVYRRRQHLLCDGALMLPQARRRSLLIVRDGGSNKQPAGVSHRK